jgi:hypothetical protein
MSGGILRLKHSEERRLVVEKTPDAVWSTGEWTNLGDKELYNQIQAIMHTYHNKRRKKDLMAPQVTAYVPLLPAYDLNLSGLPEGINIEFLDLPGLKSVQDRVNLAVIQEQMGKAFSLVALDYMQVDEEHRQKLLGELKRVVEYLGGRTDAMIFILNRVDNRGSDDLPLETRLERLKVEIQETLDLDTLPDVIPFSARLLYYAQCAWGTTPLDSISKVSQLDRSELLKKLFKDCANILEEKLETNWEIEDWIDALKKKVRREQEITDQELQRLLGYVMEWSGGLELWQCVRSRLNKSFVSLVISPALIQVFSCFEVLSSILDLFIQNRQIENREVVEAKRDQISRIHKTLQSSSKRIGNDFQQEVKDYINALKSNDRDTRIKAQKKAEKNQRNGFSEIFDTVSEVEAEIVELLVTPVRNAFQNNLPCYDLEEQLQAVISPIQAHGIARAYDKVYRRIQNDFSEKSGMLVRKVRADDAKAKKQLDQDEKCFRHLYFEMRKAITSRAEFVIQAKAKSFESALQSLVEEQLHRLQSILSAEEVITPEIEETIMNDLRQKLTTNLPKLPNNIFSIDAEISQESQTQSEVTGKEKTIENVDKERTIYRSQTYQVGSCFPETRTRSVPVKEKYTVQETREHDVIGKVEYLELSLPTPQLMAKQWQGGVMKGRDKLWDTLCDWITERFKEVEIVFDKAVIEITMLAERILTDRLSLNETEFEEQKEFLNRIQKLKKEIDLSHQRIQDFKFL